MTKILTTLFTIALLVGPSHPVTAQDSQWTRTYGGSMSDGAYSVALAGDGGYVAAGFTGSFGGNGDEVYLIKTDSFGNLSWSRTYGGPLNDWGRSVRQTRDGGYVIAGMREINSQTNDVYLIRTDASGNLLWQRTYNMGDDDRGHSVWETSDGGFVIAGQAWIVSGPFGSYDVYVVKTDSQGNLEWQRTYSYTSYGNDVGTSVQETTDGGFIIGGFTQSVVWAALLIKTDSLGEPDWIRTYGVGGSNECYSILQTTDGGYVFAGVGVSYRGGDGDILLAKTDANGAILWMRTYGGSDEDWAQSVQETREGGYIVAGQTGSFGAGVWDVHVMKTDAEGDSLWARAFGGNSDDRGFSVRQTPEGGYIVGGWAWSFGQGLGDLYLIKLTDPSEPPAVSIALTPDNPPVMVPRGGSFGYTWTLSSQAAEPLSVDVWMMANVPGFGLFGPLEQFNGIDIAPNETVSDHLVQQVPNRAPLGTIGFIGYTGFFPSTVIDSSFFKVEVIEGK